MAMEGMAGGGMGLVQYIGSDLSISELCHALKLKLAQTRDSRNSFPLLLAKSLVSDISNTVAPLCRMINHHDSPTHCLPPEALAAVASHLGANASLITATHVCHFWRTTLLSSPRLWSHLDFKNEERALVFLGRSKSTPLGINLTGACGPSEVVRELLNEIATRVTTLWAGHGPFLDELLTHPMPKLEVLKINDSIRLPPKAPAYLPSLTSLVISGFDPLRFHAPVLTSFHLTHDTISKSWKIV